MKTTTPIDDAQAVCIVIETHHGKLLATAEGDVVTGLYFDGQKYFPTELPPLVASPVLMALQQEIAEYFAGQRRDFSVALLCCGTPFERRAWEYLRSIPFGQIRNYAQQAAALGSPGAARAAGRANGMNFLAIVIPCHRVVGAAGQLTGYGGGLARKRWLLDHATKVAASASKVSNGKNGLYRGRTDTPFRAQDFESSASANSAKRPAGEL